MKVLVLGAGKMIESILTGLKISEDLSQWSIYSPSGVSAQRLAHKVGAQWVSTLDSISKPDWVIIGCKPQQLQDLATSLQGRFHDALYISILAAASESHQLKILGIKKLVRVMPNLPVAFRKGISLLASSSVNEELKQVKLLFGMLGEAPIVTENELDELTLLTGSGPALFYEFTSLLAASFSSLSKEEREVLARKVLLGAAMAATHDSKPLSDLIDAVTSKGGVTIAVLNEWRKESLDQLISKGITAGKARSLEIKSILQS